MASQRKGVSEIAGRYATALFDLADERGLLDRIAADLRDLAAMLRESAELRRLVRSPLLSRADQAAAMAALLEKSGACEETRNFVAVAARNRRLFALPAMIDAYLAMVAERRGEVAAQVTAAHPLSEPQVKALGATLRKLVGAEVAIDLRLDPGLLGGLVVKVGSKLYDSSLRTQLQKLELAMKGAG